MLLIVHYLLLPQLAGARKSLSVIGGINPLLLLAGVAAEALSLAAYAQLTRSLIPGGHAPGVWSIARIQLATSAASHVVPGGAAAGTSLGYRLLRRAGISAGDAGFVLGVQGIGSAVVLNVVLWAALLVSLPFRGADAAYVGVAVAGAVLIGGFGLLVVAMSRGSGVADRFVRTVGRRVRFVDADALSAFLHGLVDRFRQLSRDRRLMRVATGWAVAQWLTDAASLWIFLAAVGLRMEPDGVLIAFGLANVSAAIPLTPGGVGIYEAVLTSGLVGFGAPRAEAIIGVLAYRLFEFWLPIPIGAVAYLSIGTDDHEGGSDHVTKLDAAYTESRARAETPRTWAQRLGFRPRRD